MWPFLLPLKGRPPCGDYLATARLACLDRGFAMASDWKPWYERITEFDTPQEKEQFMQGITSKGAGLTPTSAILLGVLAGYVGGKIAKPKDSK